MSAQSDETASYDVQSPIAVLEEEHALILRALDVLEAELARIESGASVGGTACTPAGGRGELIDKRVADDHRRATHRVR